MNRKFYLLFAGLSTLSVLFAACGGGAVSTVEVTRVVEVTSAAPAATSEVKVQVVTPGERTKTIQDRGQLIATPHP